jgi:hypothetical protein
MKKMPMPNLDGGRIRINTERDYKTRFRDNESELFIKGPTYTDMPKGWSNRWPDLPNPDDLNGEFDLENIKLSSRTNPCKKDTLLGYYIGWHIIGVSFKNENGYPPKDANELKRYNDNLPTENRYGIHICCNTIEEYINKFSTNGLEPEQVPLYLEYCTYLTMIYVVAHEWGHYRSEALSFQISNLVRSVSGEENNGLSPSYLSYFVFKKEYPTTNFEEVFAEWASLKLGIFNYYMKQPAFAKEMSNWPIVEATVKLMLTEVISRPTRIRPYSDIRHWVDFNRISKTDIMQRISLKKRSVNRSVNDNVLINKIKSFKKGKFIDLLMHNQMQFSLNHKFNGVIESASSSYTSMPDSSFYHFGDDECLEAHEASSSENYLKLNNPYFDDPNQGRNSRIKKVIDGLKDEGAVFAYLPIKVFADILPLDGVYFHI